MSFFALPTNFWLNTHDFTIIRISQRTSPMKILELVSSGFIQDRFTQNGFRPRNKIIEEKGYKFFMALKICWSNEHKVNLGNHWELSWGFSAFTSVGSPELQSFIGGCLRQQRTKVPPRVGGGSSETANNRQNLVGESEATWWQHYDKILLNMTFQF